MQGYFKAEGLELEMGAYGSARDVVEAVAAGRADFGLTEFTPTAFNLAGQGAIKAVAAQAREKRDYEGAELVASNAAYAKGLRKFENLAGKTVAIETLGTVAHYQLGRDRARQRFRSGHDVRDRALFEQRDGKSD